MRESSISHIITLMTLSLSIIKDLRSSFLIFTPKNSQFPKPQNLPQLLLIFDLLFTRDTNNNITTKLYHKRDTFGFHFVNFPFMSSDILSSPAYDVYASQLIRYACFCSNYSDFLSHHRALVTRLLLQRVTKLIVCPTHLRSWTIQENFCQMFADSIS